MNKAKEQLLPGEFDLKVIEINDAKDRGSLKYYYAVGGNKSGDGVFQGKILKQENGWTLLKNLTVRFSDTDMYYNTHEVIDTEDHIWIFDDDIFKKHHVGDNIEFNAKVYAYHRNPAKHNGKTSTDFSLKDICNVKVIKKIRLSTERYEKQPRRTA